MRICSKCHTNKEESLFYSIKAYYCKECSKAAMKQSRVIHKESISQQRKIWYRKNKELQKARNKNCYLKKRDHYIAKTKIWRQENNSYDSQWRKKRKLHILANRANARFQDQITSFDIWTIAKKQKMKCALTGVALTSSNISLDHIIPKTKNGKNVRSNLQLIIKDINRMKSNFLSDHFISLCISIVKHQLEKRNAKLINHK